MSKVTEDNYLEVFDQLSPKRVFELANYIVWCYKMEWVEVDEYLFEKPWKYPEIMVPAMNGDLEGRVTEILEASREGVL